MSNQQSESKGGGHDQPTVEIIVDEQPFNVRPGLWNVADLKATCDVNPARVLAEITPQGLKDLEDSGKIAVHPHQRFMSHVREGSSS